MKAVRNRHIARTGHINTSHYIEIIRAITRATYESLYMIDFKRRAFEYVSENPLFLCGLSVQEVLEMGFDFYSRNVLPEDQELLFKIKTIGLDFYHKLPLSGRTSYTISYDFHLVNQDKTPILIIYKLTPLYLSEDGEISKALCIVGLSYHDSSGHICISKQDSQEIWKYNLNANKWSKEEKTKLSERELEMLRLYARGA
ncbi:helix-turn-helix transcriptional regulator [Elizabethkingia argentiflava]|uniref:Helix-turn-helix transcriptional regulator n=1 Tax=Elizabethkingia argenteiflava TaxID=2681556 RepID=A0A845PPZ7_9FLAO|nr:helix-turn-helix transcriptional regulator [Elizabethkingia argenteiflava]NAW50232.1 helix-turn-helix transcriptional regulator [Elizabethkingia argenteiflava]